MALLAPKLHQIGAAALHGVTQLLGDIVRFPSDGVDLRYKCIGVGASKGHRFKRQLIDVGLVTSRQTKVGKTYRILLEPTAFVQRLLSQKIGGDS